MLPSGSLVLRVSWITALASCLIGKSKGKGAYLAVTEAKVKGDKLIVTSDEVKSPKAVRYGWVNDPVQYPLNLYNGDGLPASTFRTDDWDPAPKK